MKHMLAVFTILGLLITNIHAQNIDSLENLLDKDMAPRAKVDLLLSLANAYDESDSSKTWQYTEQVIRLAKEVNYPESIPSALFYRGWMAMTLGNVQLAHHFFDSASVLSKSIDFDLGFAQGQYGLGAIAQQQGEYHKALALDSVVLEIAETIGNHSLKANCLNSMGLCFESLGDFEQAVSAYERSKIIFEEIDDLASASMLYNNLGGILLNTGDFANGLQHFFAGLAIDEARGDELAMAETYNNIAFLHYMQQQLEESLDYLKKSLALSEKNQYPLGMAYAFGGLGAISMEMADMESALAYLLQAAEINEEMRNLNELSDNYGSIALIYGIQGNLLKAQQYSEKSVEIAEKIGNAGGIVLANLNAGQLLLNHGQLTEAMRFLESGLLIARSIELQNSIKDILEVMIDVAEASGNYQQAFQLQKEFRMVTDSLRNDENTKTIARLEAQYEFDKEKKEIQAENERNLLLQEQALQRQRLFILIGVILVFAFVIIGVLIARFRIRSKAQENAKIKEIGQFKEAMTGMIAHDLKNPLAVIMGLSTDKSIIRNVASHMLRLINNMLDVQKFETTEVQLNVSSISLDQVVEEAVGQVATLAEEKNIRIQCDLVDGLATEADDEMMLRVLINLLTNAIKYSPNNGIVSITVKHEGDEITLAVADQGQGIPEDQLESIFGAYQQFDPRNSGLTGSTGLGLTFCKLALQAHGTDIEVKSEIGVGTTFSFVLNGEKDLAGLATEEAKQVLELSNHDKSVLIPLLPELRTYKLHQAVKMAAFLDQLRNQSLAVENWVNAVLNAAHNGNTEHFNDLLGQVDG